MGFNLTSIKTSSAGAWQGDNPLNYAFPLLIVQTTIVLFITRFLAFLLKPLRQPKVIAEIVGGIVLGPSALGRNKDYMHWIFPSWSTPILESVASLGLLFFLFLVGLELDLTSIRRSGKIAFGIAIAGISLPFLFGIGVTFLLRGAVDGADRVGYLQSLLFMGVSLSITAFPVLARILAELKLLTTQVGETAMAAAAFNDVAAWILLALAMALAGNNGNGGGAHKSTPLISMWVLISGVAFVVFMLVIVRPGMNWVARQSSLGQTHIVDEAYICLTLAGVMVSGFMTDLIGIHAIFGAFVFGLIIPKDGEFAGRLIKRIEDFVTGLLLPLYFASSGLKTDIAKIRGVGAWGLLVVVISTACAGKILGTFVVAMLCMIPARESLALGVLMNTKGLVELIVLNIGKEKKVLNDEMFAILVIMALFTTFMTTPAIMAIYRPTRGISSRLRCQLHREKSKVAEKPREELRILACVHGPKNSPSLINLIEVTRSADKSPLKLYVMQLVELTERSSSIAMVLRARKNGFPCMSNFRRGELHGQVAAAFEVYGQLGRVTVRPTTAISALSTMHEDICHVAEKKRVGMIILPFHKQWMRGEGDEEVENVGRDWGEVNCRVLENALCSVAVLMDRGFVGVITTDHTVVKRVCIVFLGGPDDREALELGGRMAKHPAVKVTVVRFVQKAMLMLGNKVTSPLDSERQKELDETALAEFKRSHGVAQYVEKAASNVVEEVLTIGQSKEYELVVVGKGRFPPSIAAELEVADSEAEHAELGPIGGFLASSGQGIVSSVLVIQQHNDNANEALVLNTNNDKDATASSV